MELSVFFLTAFILDHWFLWKPSHPSGSHGYAVFTQLWKTCIRKFEHLCYKKYIYLFLTQLLVLKLLCAVA